MATKTTKNTVAQGIKEETVVAQIKTLTVTTVSAQAAATPDVKNVVTPDVLKTRH